MKIFLLATSFLFSQAFSSSLARSAHQTDLDKITQDLGRCKDDISSLNYKTVSLYSEIKDKQQAVDNNIFNLESTLVKLDEKLSNIEQSQQNKLETSLVSDSAINQLKSEMADLKESVRLDRSGLEKTIKDINTSMDSALKTLHSKIQIVAKHQTILTTELKGFESTLNDKLALEARDNTMLLEEEMGKFRFAMARDSANSRFKDGDWVVIQKRGQFGNPEDYFSRSRQEYIDGFGDPAKEFWLGLDKISRLSGEGSRLRIQLTTWENREVEAEYSLFKVDGYPGYRLEVSGYSGNAGDCMRIDNGMEFSTMDHDSDKWNDNCSALRGNGGWWFNACGLGNLNGLNREKNGYDGILWFLHDRSTQSYKSTLMMIKSFNPTQNQY